MTKTGDRSTVAGAGAPGVKGKRKANRRGRRRNQLASQSGASAPKGEQPRPQASFSAGEGGGSSLPEGIKRQKRPKRSKPNRAERRALAQKIVNPPVVEVAQEAGVVKLQERAPAANDAARVKSTRSGKVASDKRQSTLQKRAGTQEKSDLSKPKAYQHSRPGNKRHSAWDAAYPARRGPSGERRSGFGFAQSSAHAPSTLYAALDLGTNNCRLLIARPEHRGFRVVDAYSRIVRLGEGLGSSKELSSEAMQRAIEALKVCHSKLVERGVERMRLIATEACRAAGNGEEFIRQVEKQAGLQLEIVSQETEARLAVSGCVSLVDPEAYGVLLFDIGGGSSEIVWLDLRNRQGARGYALTRFIRTWTSLPLGVVNLAERHGGHHVTPASFEAMVADVSQRLEQFPMGEQLARAIATGNVHMLGTSGTVTTLAGVHLGLKRYDRRRVDGAWMDTADVSAMIERLLVMTYEERVENPCIGRDRADLVLAGCAILEAIRRRWPCERLRVADRGLREGILMELMAEDKVWRTAPGKRRPQKRKEER